MRKNVDEQINGLIATRRNQSMMAWQEGGLYKDDGDDDNGRKSLAKGRRETSRQTERIGHDTCISVRSIELVPCFGLFGRRGSSTGETARRLICDGFCGCSSGIFAMCPLGGASLCSLPADEPDSGIETELSSFDLEDPARWRPPSTLQANGSFGSSIDILKNIPATHTHARSRITNCYCSLSLHAVTKYTSFSSSFACLCSFLFVLFVIGSFLLYQAIDNWKIVFQFGCCCNNSNRKNILWCYCYFLFLCVKHTLSSSEGQKTARGLVCQVSRYTWKVASKGITNLGDDVKHQAWLQVLYTSGSRHRKSCPRSLLAPPKILLTLGNMANLVHLLLQKAITSYQVVFHRCSTKWPNYDQIETTH